ncbi:hypothetical protein TNCV_3474811 [Trichonephila clavipes]|nr:hypothetical protein TNCV_3474811 [Trichonephila clavipes]
MHDFWPQWSQKSITSGKLLFNHAQITTNREDRSIHDMDGEHSVSKAEIMVFYRNYFQRVFSNGITCFLIPCSIPSCSIGWQRVNLSPRSPYLSPIGHEWGISG